MSSSWDLYKSRGEDNLEAKTRDLTTDFEEKTHNSTVKKTIAVTIILPYKTVLNSILNVTNVGNLVRLPKIKKRV